MTNVQKVQNLEEIENFEQFFKKKIEPKLLQFEKSRKTKLWLYFGTIVAGLVSIIVLLYKMPIPELLSVVIVSAILIAELIKKRFRKQIKNKIFNLLFSFLGDFSHTSNNIAHHYYKDIPLFDSYNRPPIIDDYIFGKYKNLPIEIEELTLNKRVRSGKHSHTITIYSGLFLSFPQLKTTTASIITANKKFQYANLPFDRVKLEDVEYEKIYRTCSNNQIESRYILTPKLMEKLKKLAKHNINVAVCFHDKMVYVGIATNKNMFEPPFFKSVLKAQEYKEIMLQLQEVLQIIDILEMDKKAVL